MKLATDGVDPTTGRAEGVQIMVTGRPEVIRMTVKRATENVEPTTHPTEAGVPMAMKGRPDGQMMMKQTENINPTIDPTEEGVPTAMKGRDEDVQLKTTGPTQDGGTTIEVEAGRSTLTIHRMIRRVQERGRSQKTIPFLL